MATFTPNYGLHQWEPEDSFLRTDFNEDFQRIDEILDGLAAQGADCLKASLGSYQGDGGENREITLGFRPKAVFLRENGSTLLNMALDGAPLEGSGTATPMLTVTEEGFQVHYGVYYVGSEKNISFPYTNREGKVYYYGAFH